jgi:hypothetical protein
MRVACIGAKIGRTPRCALGRAPNVWFLRLFYNQKVVTLFRREPTRDSGRSDRVTSVRHDALEPYSFGNGLGQ